MKRVFGMFVLICLCIGLVGCGGKDEPWKDSLNDVAKQIGINNISDISDSNYEDGDTVANPVILTKSTKGYKSVKLKALIKQDTSDEGEWNVFKIENEETGEVYFINSSFLDDSYIDIYDYKTGKISKPSKEIEESKEVSESTEHSSLYKVEKFIKNGYEDFNGNFRKDRTMIDGTVMHILFDMNGKYYDVSDDTGISMSYFWNENWAGHDYCKYDFNANGPKDGAQCSDESVQTLSTLKETFGKEMKTLGLTIEDLNR